MAQLIFINLPVADLPRSIAFYEAVGATRNPMFSDDTAACMVVSDVIHVMLLTHDKWRTFTDRQIPDAHASAAFTTGSYAITSIPNATARVDTSRPTRPRPRMPVPRR